jgi:hypothetical protein
MVAIFPLIRDSFVKSCNSFPVDTVLCLSKSQSGQFEFSRMRDLLAGREREQAGKARINPHLSLGSSWDRVRLCVDE